MFSAANPATISFAKLQARRTRAEELQRQILKMFRRLRVAVIYAGDKSAPGSVINESGNPRSWKSYEVVARDIAAALTRLGCREVAVLPEDMRLGSRLKAAKTHLAWINSGGVQGYSSVSHAPAMLEMFGIPYVGHDPMAAAMLDNKHVFKRQLKAAGLPTSPFAVWHPSVDDRDFVASEVFKSAFGDDIHGRFIVKPVSGRASLHVHCIDNAQHIRDCCISVFESTKNHVLIERYLSGREYAIGVSGAIVSRRRMLERLPDPFAFSPIERVLDVGEKIFTSMDQKPITANRARSLSGGDDPEIESELKLLARQVYQFLGLESVIRIDLRADENGVLKILEANPKPDLKANTDGVTSLISMGLDDEGMDYDDLILSLLADRIDGLFAQSRGVEHQLRALI